MVLVTLPEYSLFNFNDIAILAFAWRLGEHFLASWDVLWSSWIDRVVILVTRVPCADEFHRGSASLVVKGSRNSEAI